MCIFNGLKLSGALDDFYLQIEVHVIINRLVDIKKHQTLDFLLMTHLFY